MIVAVLYLGNRKSEREVLLTEKDYECNRIIHLCTDHLFQNVFISMMVDIFKYQDHFCV